MGVCRSMGRYELHLARSKPNIVNLVETVPVLDTPPLPPDWLRCEVLERSLVVHHAGITPGETVLEVGAGGHAISTLPLALEVGPKGRVFAIERSRWAQFRQIVWASGLDDRTHLVACDARHLPFRPDSVDVAACVHGVRSLGGEEAIVEVLREMFRVAPRVFLAESLPIARNNAQAAHLAMYALREQVFEATTGRKDDRHYLPLHELSDLVEQAGGLVTKSITLEIDLPHALAYFPREMVESVPGEKEREELLHQWDEAKSLIERHGEDHPPVGVILADRHQER